MATPNAPEVVVVQAELRSLIADWMVNRGLTDLQVADVLLEALKNLAEGES
jgi:hypothetical protein